MTQKQLKQRWSDAAYVSRVAPAIETMFREKRWDGPLDLRGAVIGPADGASAPLENASFRHVIVSGLDAAAAEIGCNFSDSWLSDCRFVGAQFDTCLFIKARFEQCDFSHARLDQPSFDDAVILDGRFAQALMIGKRVHEYGGRRTVFERCDFTGTVFDKVELRACRFRSCTFEGVVFKKCVLLGTKFEDGAPADDAFVDCER